MPLIISVVKGYFRPEICNHISSAKQIYYINFDRLSEISLYIQYSFLKSAET